MLKDMVLLTFFLATSQIAVLPTVVDGTDSSIGASITQKLAETVAKAGHGVISPDEMRFRHLALPHPLGHSQGGEARQRQLGRRTLAPLRSPRADGPTPL